MSENKVHYKNLNKDGRYRNLFITLGRTKDFTFSCSDKEKEDLAEIFRTLLTNKNDYAIIQAELYEDGGDKWHYHILLKFANARKCSTIKTLGSDLLQLFSQSDIRIEKCGNLHSVIGYCFKEREKHEPIILGNLTEKIIDSCIALRKRSLVDNPVITRNRSQKNDLASETLLINTVSKFMKENGVVVNSITRKLIGMEYAEFMRRIEEELNVSKIYSLAGVKKVKSMIVEDCFYVLPMWYPDLDILRFADFDYRISTGKKEEINNNITPFYISQDNFPGRPPKNWLTCVKLNNFDLNNFIPAFSLFYKKKRRRDKVLYIYGKTQTGKSTTIEPYVELYRDICCYVSEEGKFSFSHICNYPKVIMNEFDYSTMKKSEESQIKNFFEGAEFNIPIKNKPQTTIGPKNVVVTSNYDIKSDFFNDENSEINIDAMKSRVNIYKTVDDSIKTHNPEVINNISKEAASVCVLCTQTEEYIQINTILNQI